MELYKRDCGINMRLVPYGGGWTDVYLDIQGDSHYFIISNVMGDQFEDLLAILYCLYPGNAHESYQYVPNMDMKHALKKATKNGYVTVRIADDTHDWEGVCADIPWKARFAWYDEEAGCSWELEREPNEDLDFDLKIRIAFNDERFEYQVRYADFCYAVAKTCTEALKKHGFTGYHEATQTQDINLHHLLFVKGIALNNLEACRVTRYKEKGQGETSDFSKELELLLFDM